METHVPDGASVCIHSVCVDEKNRRKGVVRKLQSIPRAAAHRHCNGFKQARPPVARVFDILPSMLLPREHSTALRWWSWWRVGLSHLNFSLFDLRHHHHPLHLRRRPQPRDSLHQRNDRSQSQSGGKSKSKTRTKTTTKTTRKGKLVPTQNKALQQQEHSHSSDTCLHLCWSTLVCICAGRHLFASVLVGTYLHLCEREGASAMYTTIGLSGFVGFFLRTLRPRPTRTPLRKRVWRRPARWKCCSLRSGAVHPAAPTPVAVLVAVPMLAVAAPTSSRPNQLGRRRRSRRQIGRRSSARCSSRRRRQRARQPASD
jgi:hypothetical protein